MYWLSVNIQLRIIKELYIQSTLKLTNTSASTLFSLLWIQSERMYEFKSSVLIWLKVVFNSKDFRLFSTDILPRSLLSIIEASVNLFTNTSIFMNDSSFSNCSNQVWWSSASFFSCLYSFFTVIFILVCTLVHTLIFILIVSAVSNYMWKLFTMKAHFIISASGSISFHIWLAWDWNNWSTITAQWILKFVQEVITVWLWVICCIKIVLIMNFLKTSLNSINLSDQLIKSSCFESWVFSKSQIFCFRSWVNCCFCLYKWNRL